MEVIFMHFKIKSMHFISNSSDRQNFRRTTLTSTPTTTTTTTTTSTTTTTMTTMTDRGRPTAAAGLTLPRQKPVATTFSRFLAGSFTTSEKEPKTCFGKIEIRPKRPKRRDVADVADVAVAADAAA